MIIVILATAMTIAMLIATVVGLREESERLRTAKARAARPALPYGFTSRGGR